MVDFSCNFGLILPLEIYFMEATELTGREASELVSTFDGSGSVFIPVPPEVDETCPS
jgi:hypothetical protein